MPYGISAKKVENTRMLSRSEVPYTVCLPYPLDIPEGAVVYRLKSLRSNELVFTETDKTTMEAGQPYLVRSTGDINLNTDKQTELQADNKIWSDQQSVTDYTLRGTRKQGGQRTGCLCATERRQMARCTYRDRRVSQRPCPSISLLPIAEPYAWCSLHQHATG